MCIQHTSNRLHAQKMPHFVYTKKNKISCPCRRRHRASISFARNESCYFYVNAIATKNACNRTSYIYINVYVCIFPFFPHSNSSNRTKPPTQQNITQIFILTGAHIYFLWFSKIDGSPKKKCACV